MKQFSVLKNEKQKQWYAPKHGMIAKRGPKIQPKCAKPGARKPATGTGYVEQQLENASDPQSPEA